MDWKVVLNGVVTSLVAALIIWFVTKLIQRLVTKESDQLRVCPSQSANEKDCFRISVEVINTSSSEVSITCVGVAYHSGARDITYRGARQELGDILTLDQESLPYVLRPGEVVVFSGDLPVREKRKIKCAFVREASGRIAKGTSSSLVRVANKLAALSHDERQQAITAQIRRTMRIQRGYQED